MNHEQSAWAVIASPTRYAAGIQKEAGVMSWGAEQLGRAASYLKGGKSFGQRVEAGRQAFRGAQKTYAQTRAATRTAEEIARSANPAQAAKETGKAARMLRARKQRELRAAANGGTAPAAAHPRGSRAPSTPRATGSAAPATGFASATAPKGMFDDILESGSTFVKNNPGTAALGTAALGFLGHQARNAYKAYNSPMGRMARYARKNPMVAGAGLLGAGMVAKGALSRDG